ncbi:MAG: glycosyl transferase family 1 [Gemmatimonadetes bacterium]|jgi:glycosyltransferase involved in cell wall biosynthesis|nr:glycosyl transferase family 1 [Gemmatimonadota bacterium]
MRICFFGTYTIAEGYPVNRVLLKGLRQTGAGVEECRQELWGSRPLHELFRRMGPLSLVRLGCAGVVAWLMLARRYLQVEEHDVVVVGYAGHFDVLLARVLNLWRRRTIVLVAFISLYDTVVMDRALPVRSWRASLLKAIDRQAFSKADVVLVDTEANGRYYSQLFGLPSSRFRRSFVGEDDDEFRPVAAGAGEREGALQILFFGTYVPLHGIRFILEAAERLLGETDMAFTLIGNGQLFPELRKAAVDRRLENIRFVGEWVSTSELVREIGRSDVCLGIFARTEKAARVIPYKVFDAMAMRKPVVTMDSPAIRELLQHEATALLCEPGSGESLAHSLLRLRDEPGLADRLAHEGLAHFRKFGCPRAIGYNLLRVLEPVAGLGRQEGLLGGK